MVWFYSKYPDPTQSDDARDAWARVTSDLPNVDYISGETKEEDSLNVCEVNAGLTNMMTLIAQLIPDEGLAPNKANKNEANALALTRFCELFSTDEKKIRWISDKGGQDLEKDKDIVIKFRAGGTPIFKWSFEKSHFSVTSISSAEKFWQAQLQEELLPKLADSELKPYLMPYYVSPDKYDDLVEKDKGALWPLVYKDLYSEEKLMWAITRVLKDKKRNAYPMGWRWMNKLPIEDRRIQLFVLDRWLLDPDWLKTDPVIKPEFDGFMEKLKLDEAEAVVKGGYIRLFEVLAKKHPEILDPEKINEKWLGVAAEGGSLPMLKHLLGKEGADAGNTEGDIALFEAAEEGHLNIVKYLIEEKGVDVNLIAEGERNALHSSVMRGQIDVIDYLIAKGINVNPKTADSSPLYYTVSTYGGPDENRVPIIDRLIEAGADVNDDMDFPLLHFTILMGPTADWIIFWAVRGADVNVIAESGKATALMTALRRGTETGTKLPFTKALLECGAIPEAKYKNFLSEKEGLPKIKSLIAKMDKFPYPKKSPTALKYLELMRKKYANTTEKQFPRKIVSYWMNQTLGGHSHGVRKTGPTRKELTSILHSIAMATRGVKYDTTDKWFPWTIFKNGKAPTEHQKTVYTLSRYAQLRREKKNLVQMKEIFAEDTNAVPLIAPKFDRLFKLYDSIIDQYE